MVTTSSGTPEQGDPLAERVEGAGRSIIAGHPQGAVRRIGFYIVVLIALALAPAFPLVGLLGVIAVLELAVTDQLA